MPPIFIITHIWLPFWLFLLFYFKRWRAVRARDFPHSAASRRHQRPQPGGIVLGSPLKLAVHSIVGRQRVNNTRCNAPSPSKNNSRGELKGKKHTCTTSPKVLDIFKSFSLLSRLTTAPRQIETAQVHTWFLVVVVCGYFDTSFSKQVSRPFNQHQWKCESSVITQKQKRKFWGIVWWSACTEKTKN